MSDGFKRVPTVFNAEPGKTKLDVPKKSKKPFVSSFGKSTKVLSDTVKQGSEIAKKSFASSAITVKKASRSLPTLKFKKRSRETLEDDSIEAKVDKLFHSQDLLFERLDSEPKLSLAMRKSLATIKHSTKASARYIRHQPLVAKVLVLVGISVFASFVGLVSGGGKNSTTKPINEVAGVSSQDVSGNISTDENWTNKPTFTVLTPAGKPVGGVERETPSKDKIYSYPDEIGQVGITVTQQNLPESFLKESATKLADIAKASYYNSVIQIDETSVYHGTDDKTGQQSFVFIREENLFFIEASSKSRR